MPLIFDNIIFNLNPYFGYSATFINFSLHPLWIFYAARCVHFTVSSGRRAAFFFLWEQMYTSGSTFIKQTKPFICHYISMPQSSNVYIKRINSTIQTRNSTVLWWLLWYQAILYNSNIFWISINVFKQSFPN